MTGFQQTSTDYPPILHRRCRVGIGTRFVANTPESDMGEGLRVGFTIRKSLDRTANSAELSVYNLSPQSRASFISSAKTDVVIEAGYLETGLSRIWQGTMTRAYSRMDFDGSWVTVLSSQDGPKQKSGRKSTSFRPGVSVSRVLTEQLQDLDIGTGNLTDALDSATLSRLGKALKNGLNLSGNTARKMRRILETGGRTVSVQDGAAQVIEPGKVFSTSATYLSPATGLEGAPSNNDQGIVRVKCRILPGLTPGFPVELNDTRELFIVDTGRWRQDWTANGYIYKIMRTTYTGDTWGTDWTAELELALVAK